MASGHPMTTRAGPGELTSAKKDLVKFSVRAQNFILQKELASKSTIGYDETSAIGIGKSGPLNLDSYLDDSVSRPQLGNRSSDLFGADSGAAFATLSSPKPDANSAFQLPQIKPTKEGILKGFNNISIVT